MGKYSGLPGDYYYKKRKDATSAAQAARRHGCKATVIRETDGPTVYRVKVKDCKRS